MPTTESRVLLAIIDGDLGDTLQMLVEDEGRRVYRQPREDALPAEGRFDTAFVDVGRGLPGDIALFEKLQISIRAQMPNAEIIALTTNLRTADEMQRRGIRVLSLPLEDISLVSQAVRRRAPVGARTRKQQG